MTDTENLLIALGVIAFFLGLVVGFRLWAYTEMTPEGRVKAKLKRHLAEHGYYQYWPVPMGRGSITVDCIACDQGHFVGIECKREGVTKPTPHQAAVMRQMRQAGATTYLVTIKDGELEWLEQKEI